MNILLSEHAGFCFGVQRAAETVASLLSEQKETVITYGELIHNPTYLADLEQRGLLTAHTPAEVERILLQSPFSVLVLRAHGISIAEEKALSLLKERYPGFRIIDMTCHFIKKIHRIAEECTDESTLFFLLGVEGHPESIGILGHARGKAFLFSDFSSAISAATPYIGTENKVILAAQTTSSKKEFKKCKEFFKKHFTNLNVFDTICSVTELRQAETDALSRRCDVMLVIGGKNSSNTQKLYEIAKKNCSAYFVETANDLCSIPRPADDATIGITAGASTPVGLIKETIKQWKK